MSKPASKKDIVTRIQFDFFPHFKQREIERLKKLCACNSNSNSASSQYKQKQVEQFYECVDSLNKIYDSQRKKLNEELIKIDGEFEKNVGLCGKQSDIQDCYKKFANEFQSRIRSRYQQFYLKSI